MSHQYVCIWSVFGWKQMDKQQQNKFGVQYLSYYSIFQHALGVTLYK